MNLKAFANTRALVIGDVMIDEFIDGTVDRLSPEAPVPVLKPDAIDSTVGYCSTTLGGAGNVWTNLKALGCQADLVGVAGPDHASFSLLEALPHLVWLPNRKTTVKRRFTCKGQHLLRLDWEDTKSLVAEETAALLKIAAPLLIEASVVVLADYAKGVVTRGLSEQIIGAANDMAIPVVVDTKRRRISQFAGAFVITPNRQELEAIVGRELESSVAIIAAMQEIQQSFQIKHAVTTAGQDGLFYSLDAADSEQNIPPVAWAQPRRVEVADVCGAGDTVVATIAAGLGCGMPFGEACQIANLAASTVVEHRGVQPVDVYAVESLLRDPIERTAEVGQVHEGDRA